MKWGTKQAVNLPHPSLPGGMPIRANGTFQFKVGDYQVLMEKVAGVKKQYTTEEVRERVVSMLDQLLLRWIVREGKDMFNIQANAVEISKGIQEELDMEMVKIGLTITGFQINAVSYPDEIQAMVNKVAGQSMVGDVGKYQQISMIDAMAQGGGAAGSSTAMDMASMSMGMMMGQQMVNQMSQNMQGTAGQQNAAPQQTAAPQKVTAEGNVAAGPKFCPNCGTPTEGMKFCANCGQKLI